MANPVVKTLVADTWTVIATNVTAGRWWALDAGQYVQTYRLTGQAAPAVDTDAAPGAAPGGYQDISSAAAIDVYVKCRGRAGRVRVDL